MKKLMNQAGLLAAPFALALAVALALNAAAHPPAAQAQASNPAADADGNGLIEITTPAQLNGMRYDLNGNGVPDSSEPKSSESVTTRACWRDTTTSSCKGYELKNNISLAGYPNWPPIGTRTSNWQAVFNGNGFSITGLNGKVGLFGDIGVDGVVKNLNVVDASITISESELGEGDRFRAGALAATNHGAIIGSYASGNVTAGRNSVELGAIGGLVGVNTGTIAASVADVDVTVKNISDGARMRVGGFVGLNAGHIHGSYAYGDVIDARTSAGSGAFRASAFAINNAGRNGEIHWSISYGNKIVNGASVADPAFPDGENSCALADESAFTCPEPAEED